MRRETRPEEPVPNESMRLYELGVDAQFAEEKSVALDSSLGLLAPERPPQLRDDPARPPH